MKITIDYIEECLKPFGYKLISKEYVRSGNRLDMICDKGHECSISWDNFKYGRRCRTCADINKARKFSLRLSDVRNYIENLGSKLISKEYKNNTQKIKIKCACGETHITTFHRVRENDKYAKCINCRDKKSKRHTYEYVKDYIKSYGYELLSDTYVSSNEYITLKCDKGHMYDVRFGNFKNGKRCPHCNNGARFSLEEVRSILSSENYTLLDSEYVNVSQRLNVMCDKGHFTTITLRDFKDGCRCRLCGSSKGERRIDKYLSINNISYIHDEPHFKDLLSPKGNPLRPDFILPDHKIWIEYDGEFHYRKVYSEDGHEKIKIHDKIKDEYAKKHGWKMIRIPYWDFDNIENILNKNLINKNKPQRLSLKWEYTISD